MKRFPLPAGWIGLILHPAWVKPFGLYSRSKRQIVVYPVAWIPQWFGLRDAFTTVTWNHEVLHAWGNPGCYSPWCLGYEGRTWKEWLAMPVQLICGLRFCAACRSYYKGGE